MDKWLRNTNVVRIIALLVGILLWFIVHIDEQVGDNPGASQPQYVNNTINDVSIKTIGLDTQQYKLVDINPKTADITVTGRRSSLLQVSTKDGNSRLLADLSEVAPGVNRVRLQALGFPEGVTVTVMDPTYVDVTVERIEKKEVPVRVEVTGIPGNGFEAGEPVVNPNQVHVTAAKSVLDQIVAVRARVDIDGAVEAVSAEPKLEAIDAGGQVLGEASIVPTTVSVDIPITVPFKTVPLQIRMLGQPPEGYSVVSYEQSINEITVYGPEVVLEDLTIYDGLDINLSLLTSSKSYTFNIPIKDKIEQVYPASVDVQITIVPSETRTFENVPIRLNGANGDYDTVIVEPEDGTIDVTVEGAPANLNNLEVGNLEAIVDVSNLPLGSHERELRINLPVFLKIGSETTRTITIEVRNKTEDADATPDPPLKTEQPADQGETNNGETTGSDNAAEPPPATTTIENEVSGNVSMR